MISYVKDILVGFNSLLAGMGVTIRYFVKPIVTVQYPREKLTMSPAYRGHTEFVIDPETQTHRCIACEMCSRICPSQLIHLEGVKVGKKKLPSRYVIDYHYCSLCGLCVEVCPTQALKFSDEYRLAGFSREDAEIDVFARLQAQQRRLGYPVTPIPEPQPEAEAEAKAPVEGKAKTPAKPAAKKAAKPAEGGTAPAPGEEVKE
jgi:NADH-quinone oxidoreductase subunit I